MPKYDFVCPECKIVKETIDTNPIDCDKCKAQMKRKYSFAGTILKGAGWYSVDKRRTDGGTIGIEDPN